MKLPFTIIDDLPPYSDIKWQQQFVKTGRVRHEGVWRRTQEPKTQKHSGYKTDADARWKLVHFFDEYNLEVNERGCDLVLEKPYVWVNTALPSAEMDEYYHKTLEALNAGNWKVELTSNGVHATRENMVAEIKFVDRAEAQHISGLTLPEDYQVLDMEVFGPEQHLSEEERGRPWNILKGGIRKPLQPGNPTVVHKGDDFDIAQYMPFHLELGCGPSIEAGVPPLSHLHKTYAISNPKTHDFIFGNDDDLPVRLFSNPEAFYLQASLIYATALKAEPTTAFYRAVKRLYDEGKILAPVFTNNYDGLTADLGLPEHYLRKFDDSHLFPDVDFSPEAKALVVVGSHADRRKIQEKARVHGLQVIYVDPQHYEDDTNHESYQYSIEAPQDDDILVAMTAKEFTETFLQGSVRPAPLSHVEAV